MSNRAIVVVSSLVIACAPSVTRIPDRPLDRATAQSLVERAPGDAAAWRDLGWLDYLAGDTAKARTELEKAGALDGSDARVLLGLATLAHESGEHAKARDLWTRILERTDARGGDGWAAPVQEVAAAKLVALTGEVAGEREWRTRLAAIDAARLSSEARARLFAVRAHLARRFGDEAEGRRLDGARACPTRWRISGPYGRRARLDLALPFTPGDGGSAPPASEHWASDRACSFTLDTRTNRPGVAYAGTWMHLERAATVSFTVATQQPWRLHVDGALAWREDDEARFPPRTRTVDVALPAGWHRVDLKLAAPGFRHEITFTAQSDAPLALADAPPAGTSAPRVAHLDGKPRRSSPPPADPRWTVLAQFLVGNEAARSGDPDVGAGAIAILDARAPRFVPGLLLEAQIAAEDPTVPARFARDRARRLLEKALALDPHAERARYNLASIDLQDEHPDKALSRIGAQTGWRASLLRYQAFRARGWQLEADRALAAALAQDPEACPAVESAVSLARDRYDYATAKTRADELTRCNPTASEKAELLKQMGAADAAVAEYKRLLAIDPTSEPWRDGLADVLAQSGHWAEAVAVLDELVREQPLSTSYRRKLADDLLAMGDRTRAEKVLLDGVERQPDSDELAKALAALGVPGPLEPFRVDGKQVIADFERAEKAGRRYPSPAVIILDRTVLRVFPNGARQTLTHNIIRVQTKDGIDKFGEVQIPEGADLLLLRTVKADGTTREPEEIAEKQSVSVPDLEPGDYVEFEYVDRTGPSAPFRGGFLGERFYFNSYDAPLDRTEFVVAAPLVAEDGRTPMQIQIDARGPAPKPREEQRTLPGDGRALRVYTWSDRYKPQLVQEPQQTPFTEYVASVRVGSGVSFEAFRDYLRDDGFGTLRASRELDELAHRLAGSSGASLATVRAIDEWVRHHIKNGGTLDEPATGVLARAEGNRIVLEQALLRDVGIPSTVWLVHPRTNAELDGVLPDLEGFDEPVLAVDVGGTRVVLDPRFRHGPIGFLAPPLRAQRALAIDAAPKAQFATTPDAKDARDVTMDVTLADSGEAEISVDEQLAGWPAVEWREGLDRIAADRVRAEFEQRTLGFFFPGASLVELAYEPRDADDAPFHVRYKFRAPRLGSVEGRRLLLGAPFPALLGRRYVGVARRETPLQLQYAAPTHITATYHLPSGAQPAPGPTVRADAFGHFAQTVTAAPGALRLDAEFTMPMARVPPARYADFAKFAETVDSAESRMGEVVLKP